jgi:hypothetical protein
MRDERWQMENGKWGDKTRSPLPFTIRHFPFAIPEELT